jgi:fused signal recognition particle receptor
VTTTTVIIIVVAVVVVLLAVLGAGLALRRSRRISLTRTEDTEGRTGYQAGGGITLAPGGQPTRHPVADRPEVDGQPGVGDDAAVPRDAPRRGILDIGLPTAAEPVTEPVPAQREPPTETLPAGPVDAAAAPEAPPVEAPPVQEPPVEAPPVEAPPVEVVPPAPTQAPAPTEEIAPVSGRLERLRGRLSRSQSTLGSGLLGLLGAGNLDEDSWTDVEDTLLMADLGAATTIEIVEKLRAELVSRGVRTADQARALLREVLVEALHPDMDRAVRALPHEDGPAVVLVAGVNGTGKTTTTGKLARVLVADGRRVLLGAADTFRAAAAEQLATWADRVGAEVVRGKEGADPAAVAFDAVKRGVDTRVDTVVIDTAGRLHTKTGLMDELGKVKRVVEKQAKVDEVLLVLDATTGQNGLTQARVFAEIVDVTGIALTKLDGTAKGGIVFQVQRELGVPVKLVGLGEGPDDLAPFEPGAFVDALLG